MVGTKLVLIVLSGKESITESALQLECFDPDLVQYSIVHSTMQ